MTLGKLLQWGCSRLEEIQLSEAQLDAWYLLEYVTGCTKSEYYLFPDREVSEETVFVYQELIEKRASHIPLQYLTGTQEFMGFSFAVSEAVLIPRQDTEILVEEALPYLKEGMKILDMCTGSGCILLSLLKLQQGLEGIGADISKEALKIAKVNQESLQVSASLIESNLFENITEKYDRIFSNPPYIPSQVVDTLMEEVKDHEPRLALDGREDGLYFYETIIKESPNYLHPNGMLFFEIGHDQARAVSEMMKKDFIEIQVVKDLAGLDRVVYGTLRS